MTCVETTSLPALSITWHRGRGMFWFTRHTNPLPVEFVSARAYLDRHLLAWRVSLSTNELAQMLNTLCKRAAWLIVDPYERVHTLETPVWAFKPTLPGDLVDVLALAQRSFSGVIILDFDELAELSRDRSCFCRRVRRRATRFTIICAKICPSVQF